MADWSIVLLWTALAAVLAGYLVLFALARRPVSLRPARLAAALATAGLLRLLVACGPALEWPLDGGLTILALAGAAGLVVARRFWLVRGTAEEVREQVRAACGGLFLGLQEPGPGRLVVTAKGQEQVLRLVGLGRRVQGLRLYPRPAAGKTRLLWDWLAKQYPGPVPRVRITLKGDEP